MSAFSYRKFTELQIQGAHERATRSVEMSQHEQLEKQAHRKWLFWLRNREESDHVISLHQQAITDVFTPPEARPAAVRNGSAKLFADDDDGDDGDNNDGHGQAGSRADLGNASSLENAAGAHATALNETYINDSNDTIEVGIIIEEEPPRSACAPQRSYRKEMSPFLTARLARISCQEYKNILGARGMRHLENDVRVLVNWLHEASEKEERDDAQMQKDLKQKIEDTRKEITQLEMQQRQRLRDALLQKRETLRLMREQKLKEMEHRQNALASQRTDGGGSKPSTDETTESSTETMPQLEEESESSAWVDVEDENKEWIICK
eukprot:CAMPEP_0198124788 /NCGR_PEP_ID=MMETSP1442-20131203/40889_1 /TAXON_ID= /ORGANISM="Craspedostauros australis, Strain CCMP3328" /LENGTH=321 /DNA_ID=CAMNT_0043784263 /DNA_START=5 /DNA_END=970 /DNA_ORIENTATION=-